MIDKDDISITIVPLNSIIPYENNAKIHSKEQIRKLAALITKNGWTNPIIIQKSNNVIIAGHGRRLAAIELGLKKVPTIILDVNDQEAAAMRLSDNRVSSNEYDTTILKEEVINLRDLGVDLESLAFDTKELEFLVSNLSEINEDAFVEDIQNAVNEQKEENSEKQKNIDSKELPIHEAFGFKKVRVVDSRAIKAFMNSIEAKTGLIGVEALIEHINKYKDNNND